MSERPEDRVELTRGDVRRAFWLWTFFAHANYNYERLQGTAFAHAMTPIIRKLYRTPDEIRAALKRHLVFFNTDPNLGGMIHGAVIAMEEQRANGAEIDDDAINAVKTGLMGPLAGIGDVISQGTVTPILLAIGIGITQAGSILGPILYFVLEVAILTGLAYVAWMQGYERGRAGVTGILRSGLLDRVVLGAGVLGNMVMGALTYQYVHVYLTWTIDIGKARFDVTRDILDKIMPGILPLAFILVTWWLLARRRVSPILLLVLFVVVAMIAAVPVFGSGNACPSVLEPFYQCVQPSPSPAAFLGG